MLPPHCNPTCFPFSLVHFCLKSDMWRPSLWIYPDEHFVKLLFGYSPVHQWQWKEVEESEEVKSAVKHHCGALEPHHVTGLPGFVAQTKLQREQLRTDDIAFAQTLHATVHTTSIAVFIQYLQSIHKVKVQSLKFIHFILARWCAQCGAVAEIHRLTTQLARYRHIVTLVVIAIS